MPPFQRLSPGFHQARPRIIPSGPLSPVPIPDQGITFLGTMGRILSTVTLEISEQKLVTIPIKKKALIDFRNYAKQSSSLCLIFSHPGMTESRSL